MLKNYPEKHIVVPRFNKEYSTWYRSQYWIGTTCLYSF